MNKPGKLRRPLYLLLVIIIAVLGVLAINTLALKSQQPQVAPLKLPAVGENIARLLAEAIKIPTVSYSETQPARSTQLEALAVSLRVSFPAVHRMLRVEKIAEHSLLYEWTGSDTGKKPVLLTAHLDVVPVEAAEESAWLHPPFAGTVADGYVWGRGALDDKAAVVTMLYAAEMLIRDGFSPRRTVLFAFGHDEEIGGTLGAAALSSALATRGVEPAFLLDEGMPITVGILNGVKQPVALIGIAEKGSVNLELSVTVEGGHSSTPPQHTAVGILARAIVRLEQNPMPARLSAPVGAMFDALAPEMPLAQRVVLANRWVSAPLLKKRLAAKPSSNAMIRTTTAVTVISGSPKPNVLPRRAVALVNVRLLPGDRIGDVVAHVENAISDSRVELRVVGKGGEPSRISDVNNDSFNLLTRTIRQIFPEVLIAPSVLIATTDSRHYAELTDQIYRFRPLFVSDQDIARFHGKNERISNENLKQMAQFYYQLIKNTDKL